MNTIDNIQSQVEFITSNAKSKLKCPGRDASNTVEGEGNISGVKKPQAELRKGRCGQ